MLACRFILAIFTLLCVSHVHSFKTQCDHVCKEGACEYSDCKGLVSCPGGACIFTGCASASCSGGACVFNKCSGGSCDGGGCHFNEHLTTLKKGYCDGHGCTYNGNPHPAFHGHVSL